MERCTIRDAALKLQSWFLIGATNPCESANSKSKPAGPFENRNADKRADSIFFVNKPLRFALQNMDWSHPYLEERGVTKEPAFHFGVGTFSGNGCLHGRVVIPIHNEQGELVAYAGRALNCESPRYKLPANFKKSLELFNLHRAIWLRKKKPDCLFKQLQHRTLTKMCQGHRSEVEQGGRQNNRLLSKAQMQSSIGQKDISAGGLPA